MDHRSINHRDVLAGAGLFALAVALFATPVGRSVAATAFVDFIEVTERVVRFPCWVMDHSRCFSLDRLDPTCPQCM